MKTRFRESRDARSRPTSSGSIVIVGVALALVQIGCAEEPVPQAPVARPVKVFVVGSGAAGGTVEYPGQISAAQHAEMGFEVPGRIQEFAVREGQEVRQGAVLARLDPRDFEAARESATARQKAARAEYERTQALYESNSVSLQDLEVARRNAEMATAQLKTETKAVEDTILKAPFSGIVAKKMVEDFANLQAKETILILQDNSSLEIKVNIPEQDITKSRKGASLQAMTSRLRPLVVVSTIPDRSFPARMKEFSTTADPTTRTFEATLSFDPPGDVTIAPGMTARVVIDRTGETDAVSSLQIPSSAVLADDSGASFVWRLDPGTMIVNRAPVELGDLSGSQAAILGGLEDGDQIAISGVHHLREGMTVRRLDD